MTKKFASSYPPLGGITGYTSNHGVWSRLQSQQSSSPRKKKRKKWYQNLGSKPVIYQISEREEEEDYPLPLKTPDSVFSHTNSTVTSLSNSAANGDLNKELKNAGIAPVIIQELVMPNNSIPRVDNTNHNENISRRHSETLDIPAVKSVAKSFYPFKNDQDYSKQKPKNNLKKDESNQTLHVPEVIQSVKSFYPNTETLDNNLEKVNDKSSLKVPSLDCTSAKSANPLISVVDCDSNRLGNDSEESNFKATLQIPEIDQKTKSFYPPIAQSNHPEAKGQQNTCSQVTSGQTGVKGIINQPKYTHIRVPKIYNRRSQFETSKESPFYIPSLSDDARFHLPKLETKVRKPIYVSLTKNVEKPKSLTKPRKRWNFHSLDDPINYFETDLTPSVGTNEDKNSNTSEHEAERNSDKHVNGKHVNNKHVLGAINVRLNNCVMKDTLVENLKLRKLKLKTCQASVSPRKKWEHPDFWPQEGKFISSSL